MVLVRCNLTDCAFFGEYNGIVTNCSHPNKEYFIKQPCQLYRPNWEKRIKEIKEQGLLKKLITKLTLS